MKYFKKIIIIVLSVFIIFSCAYFKTIKEGLTNKNSIVLLGDSVINNSSYVPPGKSVIDILKSKTTNLFALYAQNEIKPIKPLTINIGARFDKIKSTSNESQISPRIGAVYEFNQKTKIHSGFARYITPARAELLASSNIENFRNTTNESVNNEINDKIKAERSSYYDIGINHQLNKNQKCFH